MRKPSKKPLRTFRVDIEYTVWGTVEVEAENEADAREKAHDEMVCPSTCDIMDWRTTNVREAPE